MFFAQKKVQRFLLILALAITTGFGLSLRHSEVVAAQPAAQMLVQQPAQTSVQFEANAIRPFRINVPEAALVDLRQRVVATRWPRDNSFAKKY